MNREAKSRYWQSFVDKVGLFFQELRRRKYHLLNMESIPAHRQEKFQELIRAAGDEGGTRLENSDGEGTESSPVFSVTLPPGSLCIGCGADVSGLTPHLQLQFPRSLLGADLTIQV